MKKTETRTRNGFVRYSTAACSVGVGFALRLVLVWVVGSTLPYITFFPAIMFSAWFGGVGPGIFSSLLTILVAFAASFVTVFHFPRRAGTADVIGAVIFLAVSAFISILTEELRQSRVRSEERLRQVEAEMLLRVRSEEQLKRVNQELIRANRRLEEFAYVSTHDLREPLRMVHIYTELLLKEVVAETGNVRMYCRFLRESASRIEALIRDLLSYSQAMDADEVSVGTAILSVSLSNALSTLNHEILESGATVTAEPLPPARGETAQLSHVFQNLLSNAIKYRKAGLPPQIQISAKREDDQWIVSVRDNGIGFAPEYAEHIFGLFKRLHRDAYPGTGVGLAICQRIVERYGGRIWAESMPGEGATFRFSLPSVDRERVNANLQSEQMS